MDIKVHNKIRQKPVILGLPLKSFFILLFSFVILALIFLSSLSFFRIFILTGILIAEYAALFYFSRRDAARENDLPRRIINS